MEMEPHLPTTPMVHLPAAHLDEGKAGPVVCDGEAQRILWFEHFHLLLDAPDVGKDEVLQANLPSQQLLHVDLVGVQGTEEDLHTQAHTHFP